MVRPAMAAEDERSNVLMPGIKLPIPTGSALYIWGYNDSGQTAHTNGSKRRCIRIPMRVGEHRFKLSARFHGRFLRFMDISCGLEHTAAVTSDGSLFTWGSNEFGQLGDGTENPCVEPRRVATLRNEYVKSVACGAHCTAAITEPRKPADCDNGARTRLWTWGQHQGSNHPQIFWGAFSPNTVIKQVACGAAHVAALSAEGTLQTWGYNEYGQLGRGFSCEGRQEARIVSLFVKFLDEPPETIRVTNVACGEYHTAAIADNGDVYTWGLGWMGQLGHRTLQSPNKEVLPRRVVGLEGINVNHIACGGIHTCAVTLDGSLYMWGGGQAGQLGVGPHGGSFCAASNHIEHLLKRVPVLVIPTGVRQVTCGQCHTLVAMSDGRLFGWGYNSYGQAATGRASYAWYPSPVDWCVGEIRKLAAGGGHSAVLTHAFSLKELCELKLADCITISTAPKIEDAAARTNADSLARFCGKFREQLQVGFDIDKEEDIIHKESSSNKLNN